MEYSEALGYLYSRLPVFHRIGPKALKPGLGNTLRLCEALGNPQDHFQSIHVGGTNGKGSTAHMLAAVYQSAGYRVGLYTSPHLKSFTERIRINGLPIAERDVAEFVVENQALIETVEPSFFEVTVAMAFNYFARQSVDVAIIEVGLGGRLDSTNVITPLASVITNIGYDHTDILGDTLAKIANEKAGVIKQNIPVIIGETHPETKAVFYQTAASLNAPLVFADQRYSIQNEGVRNGLRQVGVSEDETPSLALSLDLIGTYQMTNLASVLATVSVLQSVLPVANTALANGLKAVTSLTGLKGRFQTIQVHPTVIADTAHNEPGLHALFESVGTVSYTNLHIVLGLVEDKDRTAILASLPQTATFYFCQAQTPRSLPAEKLRDEAQQFSLSGAAYSDVNVALSAALRQTKANDLIVITGSNYIIAELINL